MNRILLFFILAALSPQEVIDQAITAQEECYQLDLEEGDPGNISSSLNNLAGFCLAMENYDEAEKLIREALTLSRQTGNILLQRNISQDLAVMLKDLDPRSAVNYMQDVVALSDTLYRQQTAQQQKTIRSRKLPHRTTPVFAVFACRTAGAGIPRPFPAEKE